ncbi:hypothetical protein BJI48_01120 [Helicobacter sp. 11S02596-1]|nr:hypothetical protein BJI48_01120 [Helicobacter sp. 11S02596-1]
MKHLIIKIIKLPFRITKKSYHKIKALFNRHFNKPNWKNMRHLQPISNIFGLDRGTPIDRAYTNDFLSKNSCHIQGVVCEIAESRYINKYGGGE